MNEPAPVVSINDAPGSVTDIDTARESDEAARWLAAIVDSSDDAILSKDLNSIIASWNPAAERMFGYTAEEVVGKSIRIIIPADRQHEEDEILARLRNGERIDHFETVRQRKDGTLVDVSVTVSPVRDASGTIVRASKIVRDISARRAAEAALRESIAVKDQFLGLVSHELRTPMATIYGSSLILRQRGAQLTESDKADLLDGVISEAGRLQRIIENLLLLTRLDTVGLQLEPVELDQLVMKAVRVFEARHSKPPVLFTVEAGYRALGNATYVELVLDNLLGNAAKYNADDAPIEVILGLGDGAPEVRVLDRGIGIDEGDQDKLFSPFYRSQNAMALASGMGIGLAVCKRVIDVQGGTIWAKSRVGGGAEFGFTLPAAPGT